MAKKKPYRFFLYLFFRLVAGGLYLLPRAAALELVSRLSRFAFMIVGRQSGRTMQNLRFVFGREKSEKEIQAIGEKVFEHLGMTGVDVLQFPKLNESNLNEWIDFGNACETYDALMAEGKGLLSVTAHIGNWELLAGALILKGYPGKVVARKIYYEPYNRWIVGLRKSIKVETIYRDEASREILTRLSQNKIVGMLTDQDMEGFKGIFVNFLGRPAYTTIALARLSLSSGAPILPNYLIRMPDRRYRVIAGKPIRPSSYSGGRDERVRKMTEDWMADFEKIIRTYPEQWAWMHNRWKTQPKDANLHQSPEGTMAV